MMIFKGPIPGPTFQCITPNPLLSNQESLTSTVAAKTAIDGTRYTYVKKSDRRRLLWSFVFDRPKALEFIEFYRQMASRVIEVTDHNGDVWLGHITNNPLDASTSSRGRGVTQAGIRAEKMNNQP